MEQELVFRKAVPEDTESIWEILLQAKEQMRLQHKRQWQGEYPARENIVRDLQAGDGYVLCSGDTVVSYAAVVFDGEPAYQGIKGAWKYPEPYVVVHRLAVSKDWKRLGIARRMMRCVEELSISKGVFAFRVDTNFDNEYMQKILGALHFSYCGEVQYEGDPRLAFEKSLAVSNHRSN